MSKKALIIEDNPKHADLLNDIVSDEGFHVDIARDGHEEHEKMKPGYYDLILVDIGVPGFDATEFIITYSKTEKLIVVSAYPDSVKVDGYLNKEWFIKKPFDVNLLVEKIKKIMK